MLICAVILAILIPARGTFADWFSTGTKFAVALLFYLYGARLSTSEAIAGLKHWRLHALILTCTFVIFPLFGMALFPLRFVLGDGLYLGILFLTLVPSTVQRPCVSSIAGGNVAGAIVSASLSSIVGVVATPAVGDAPNAQRPHRNFGQRLSRHCDSAVFAVRAGAAHAPLGGRVCEETHHEMAR